MSWQQNAACRGMDPAIFFPDLGNHNHAAKRVCAGCPVATRCAQAGATEEFGVWGGLNPAERHTGTQRASSYVSAERVLELLRSHRWLTRAQVARRVGMSPDAARRALYRLKDHGLAHNDHGYWWATKVTESAEGSYEAAERAS